MQYAAAGAIAMMAGSASALAQCTGALVANGFNFAPFSQGTAVNSIISTVNTIGLTSLAQSTAFISAPGNPQPDQRGSGVWARNVVGDVETKSNSSSPIFTNGAQDGTIDCRSTTDQTFYATQLGFDISRLNFAGGGAFHLGLTTGYTDATTKDKTPGQGTFRAETQAPFAGVYAAITSGNTAIDAQFRVDWLQNTLRDPTQSLADQRLDAQAYSFLWNAAHRFDLPRQWFIEPSIGGVWSRAQIDPLAVSGTFLSQGDLTGTSPGLLLIEDVHSVIGRASLRIGTTVVSGGFAVQPFLVGSIFHEFADDTRASFAGSDSLIPGQAPGQAVFSGNIRTGRIGTFGHIGAGLAGVILDTGWVGYSRVDYRFGDNIESLTFNSGLRYHFTPPADTMGLKDGGGYTKPDYNWTGLYVGGYAGALWGQQEQRAGNQKVEPQFAGILGGGTLGYNYQVGRTLLGLEGEWGASNAHGGKGCPNAFFFTCEADVNQLALITGRLGLAMDRTLFYVKGGVAFGEVEAAQHLNPGVNPTPAPTNVTFGAPLRQTEWQTGWAIGGGVEFALTDRWSAKGEYLYYDLGKEDFTTNAAPGNTISADTTGATARIGLNYHFGHRGHAAAHDEPLK